MLSEFVGQGESTEVLIPVVVPDIVTGRHEWRVSTYVGEFGGEDKKIGKHTCDDHVMLVVAESAS